MKNFSNFSKVTWLEIKLVLKIMSVWLTSIPTCLGCPSIDWWMGIHLYWQAVKCYYLLLFHYSLTEMTETEWKSKWNGIWDVLWIWGEQQQKWQKKKKRIYLVKGKETWMATMEVLPIASSFFFSFSVFFPLTCIKEWERAEKH